MPIASVQHVSKVYPAARGKLQSIAALHDVSLNVEGGEIISILGPNGAGKTTLTKLLLGITHPTSGNVSLLGAAPGDAAALTQVGFMPEDLFLPAHLSVSQAIYHWARVYGLSGDELRTRVGEVLSDVGMDAQSSFKISTLSKGMRQRTCLAQALVHNPAVLILDEPTDGLDPISRRKVRELILRERENGKTIIMNSHLLSEVERISDKVAILNKGRLVKCGSVLELLESPNRYHIEISGESAERFCQQLRLPVTRSSSGWTIEVRGSEERDRTISSIVSEGISIVSVAPVKTDLENAFISIIDASDSIAP